MKRKNIRIAIQKSGRLKEASLDLLSAIGLQFEPANGRNLIIPCKNKAVEILYVRHSDIPMYVQSGVTDFGIVGENVLFENEFNVKPVRKLGFGRCSLVIAVPDQSPIQSVAELEGERITSSYPNSLRKFLKGQGVNAAIIKISGAVEITPSLNLADAVCDITQTGKTLSENGLKPIHTIYESEAVLIQSPATNEQKSRFIEQFQLKNYENILF